MGKEKKKKQKKEDDKQQASKADKKKDAAPAPEPAIVLKVDLHCAGCASRVRRAIKHAPGVESVKTDTAANKVVVAGAADAADLKERIEARAKKPVQIVSAGAGPPPTKDKDKEKDKEKTDGAGEKKPEKDTGKPEKEKKADEPKEEEKKPKEPKEETVTLKIRLHCDGCVGRIRRRVYKIKGVKDVAVDAAKDLVKVTGTMDAAALPGYLRDKLGRPVELVAPAPGKKDGADKSKDDKTAGDGGGEKNKDGKAAGDGSGEKNKDKADGGDGGEKNKDKAAAAASASVAAAPMADASMYQMMPPQYGYHHMPYNAHYGAAAAPPPFYPNAGYYPPPYAPYPAHAPQMFSDENPNACSVM